jgi:hypothetical protein
MCRMSTSQVPDTHSSPSLFQLLDNVILLLLNFPMPRYVYLQNKTSATAQYKSLATAQYESLATAWYNSLATAQYKSLATAWYNVRSCAVPNQKSHPSSHTSTQQQTLNPNHIFLPLLRLRRRHRTETPPAPRHRPGSKHPPAYGLGFRI